MLQYPHVSYLQLRETGQAGPEHGNFTLGRKMVSFDIDPLANGFIKPTSRVVWIQGRENLTVTLNSHGQVVVYNMLDRSLSFMLTHPDENAFRIFFARDSLFLAVKKNSAECVEFYLIPLGYLQERCRERIRVLSDMRVVRSCVKEIDSEKFRVVVEKERFVEVWDLLQGSLVVAIPRNALIKYQVTNDFFVFWEKYKLQTHIGLFKFDQSFGAKFPITTTADLYLCKIIHNDLILGFTGCSLQAINLSTMSSKFLPNGPPTLSFELENTNTLLTIFPNNSCTINTNTHFPLFPSTDYFTCQLNESIIICGDNGKLAIISEEVEAIDTKVFGLQQIGSNPDTSQILLACRGKILVVE